jgi:hypothetical protein
MSPARTARWAYQASPSRVCKGLRWGRPDGKLPWGTLAQADRKQQVEIHHARAWEGVPTKSNAITVLDLAPLIFESLVVHVPSGMQVTSRKKNEPQLRQPIDFVSED